MTKEIGIHFHGRKIVTHVIETSVEVNWLKAWFIDYNDWWIDCEINYFINRLINCEINCFIDYRLIVKLIAI